MIIALDKLIEGVKNTVTALSSNGGTRFSSASATLKLVVKITSHGSVEAVGIRLVEYKAEIPYWL